MSMFSIVNSKMDKPLKIHVISTVNGQVNEGMRNIATHISTAFEKENDVRYSRLRNVGSIIVNCCICDVTIIFARANKLLYWLIRFVRIFSNNVWVVCVQKPNKDFTELVNKRSLKVNYLAIVKSDLDEIKIKQGYRKEHCDVGIETNKFKAVEPEKQKELKEKYGFDANLPLVVHVGHCSSGRGLEDFSAVTNVQKMVVASGMFENMETITALEKASVRIHRGYLQCVEEIYQMADVYLFPTHSAEFVISIPLSVMEALSCGVPVVAYQDFANLEAIPAENGAIELIRNKSELNNAVINAIGKKRDTSYLTASKTWDQVAEEVLEFVRSKK